MKKILVYFYLHDLTDESTNSIVRLTASLMKGLDRKIKFYYFFEKEDRLQLPNGSPHRLNITYRMRLIRKLHNSFAKSRICWHEVKGKAAKQTAAGLSDIHFDAILLMELEKVQTVKKLFPKAKIIYWIHSVSALCKPHYLENISSVDHFVSPSKTTYHFLLQRIPPKPMTAVFNFMPNWCESIFFKRDPQYISFLKLQFCIRENEKVFIFCGGTQKLKGAFLLEQLIEKLAAWVTGEYVFLICGSGCQSNIRSVGNIRVMNLGTVDPQGLIDLYSLADYGLHPSLAYDHCPLTLIEMINCSVFPIASDIGGIKEILGDDFPGLIEEPNNIQSWLQKIRAILKMNESEKVRILGNLQNRVRSVYNRSNALAVMTDIMGVAQIPSQ